jgi:hypothetical protein
MGIGETPKKNEWYTNIAQSPQQNIVVVSRWFSTYFSPIEETKKAYEITLLSAPPPPPPFLFVRLMRSLCVLCISMNPLLLVDNGPFLVLYYHYLSICYHTAFVFFEVRVVSKETRR